MALAVLGSCGAGSAEAAVFYSPDGLFVAEFPGPPTFTMTKAKTAKGTPFEERRWSTETTDGIWSVAAFLYATPRGTNYDAAVSGAVAAARGRLLSDQPIRQAGSDGREIVVKDGAGILRERIVSVRGNLYVIAFHGKDAAAAAALAVDEFLISFEAAG